jgi:hypothetical protein
MPRKTISAREKKILFFIGGASRHHSSAMDSSWQFPELTNQITPSTEQTHVTQLQIQLLCPSCLRMMTNRFPPRQTKNQQKICRILMTNPNTMTATNQNTMTTTRQTVMEI